jgi:hypothetical protein
MKPTVPEVLPLARAIYARNHVGCCLHIVLDDENVGDGDVQFCLEQAVKREHKDCEELARKLLSMTRTQRRKIGASCL